MLPFAGRKPFGMIDYARERISKASTPWAVVTGLAAALICTLERIGCTVMSATDLESDIGKKFNLTADPRW